MQTPYIRSSGSVAGSGERGLSSLVEIRLQSRRRQGHLHQAAVSVWGKGGDDFRHCQSPFSAALPVSAASTGLAATTGLAVATSLSVWPVSAASTGLAATTGHVVPTSLSDWPVSAAS